MLAPKEKVKHCMRKVAAVLPLLFAALVLILPFHAEAKRMGYGGSMGKQYSVPQRNTAQPTAAPNQQTNANKTSTAPTPAKSGASRWFGPLAGLVAGGLLASLLFGDGFQGIQFMDIVIILALVVGAFLLFRALRSRPAAQLRTAEGPAFDTEGFSPGAVAGSAGAMAPANNGFVEAPAWFEADGFLKGARTHYIRLQAAWDKGDMKDIAEYTTPEMFANLQSERLSRGNEQHFTEVAYLDAELLGVQRDGDNAVASIRFFGGIREEKDGAVEEFSEIWHVVHSWSDANGNWYVAGIQQR
jgi:predicted lipid-binding transport protein (Tim44 family)